MLRKRSIAPTENNFAVDSPGRRRGAPQPLPRRAKGQRLREDKSTFAHDNSGHCNSARKT